MSVRFQGKPFNITVIQAYAPTSNVQEAEVEQFYEDLQDLLERTPKKICPFHIGAAADKSCQSCLTPSDPMDCSQPGSAIHGIFQARVPERGAIAFSAIFGYEGYT